MMTIASMSGGQGSYYAGLAQEDYYLEGGEPPGFWLGEGAKRLGLVGKVDKETFLDVFDGFLDGKKLVQNAGKDNHRPGWDLTLSAPKSVSTVWSQSDREIQLEIQAAHLSAVEKVVQFLEETALWTRTGAGGESVERCKGVFAVFEHGQSRANEAQLHSHVLLLNCGLRDEGKTSALETKQVYLAKMAAGALYRAELAYQLERRLGLFAELRSKDTSFDLRGVPKELCDMFSTRRSEVLDLMEAKGLSGPVAASYAALETRAAKIHISREELFQQSRAVGKEFGWSMEEAHALMKGPQKERDHGDVLKQVCEEATSKITEQAACFRERDLLRRVAEASQVLAVGADAVRVSVKEHLENHQEIVPLGYRNREAVYTTREMLELEKDLMRRVRQEAGRPWEQVKEATLQAVMEARPTLKPEQRDALEHITQRTSSICSVTGMAGTGKTFMLSAAREALEESGYRVLGAALAGKAAEGLQKGSGIKSSTMASLLFRLEKGTEKLDSKTVLVADEAGMIGTRQMHKVVSAVHAAGAKLVLVGDERQLQPIEAGGPFGAISRAIGTSMLTDIVRQEEIWQRRAVKDFAAGEASKALKAYAERGFVSVTKNRETAREALLEAWFPKGLTNPNENLIVAATNADGTALNRRIQAQRLKLEGQEESASVTIHGQAFYGGDRIVFTRNSNAVGVKNGTFGTILSVDGGLLSVRLDDGKTRNFSPEQYSHVKLGYAVTTHKSQGATVDNVYILTDEGMQDREQTYVQSSRARKEARFFTTEAEAGDELKELSYTMARSREKLLAIDFLESSVQASSPEAQSLRKRQVESDLERLQKERNQAIHRHSRSSEHELYQEMDR